MNYRQFFTQAAIKAVEFSQYIAQRRGKGYIGTGQLLLGILHMRDTIAAETLDKFGVDYDSAEQVIRSSDGFQDVLRPDETPYYTRRSACYAGSDRRCARGAFLCDNGAYYA